MHGRRERDPMLRARGWVVLALTSPCAACALIAGIHQEGDKPDASEDAAPSVEGSTDGTTGPGMDTGTRDAGSVTDAPPSQDARNEGGSEAEGGGEGGAKDAGVDAVVGPWCDADVTTGGTGFCDDFDDKQSVTNYWMFSPPMGIGSAVFNKQTFVSAPNAAQITLPANPYTCDQVQMVRAVTNPTGTKVHAEAEIYITPSAAALGATGVGPAFYGLMLAGGNCQLNLVTNASDSQIWEVDYPLDGGPMDNLFTMLDIGMTGGWYRVTFDVDLSTPPLMLNVTIGGSIPVQVPIESLCAGTGGVSTELGYICVGDIDASVEVYFDNVLTTTQ
jgi:hypothetical protein